METKYDQIPLWIKIKTMLRGESHFKNYKVYAPKLVRLLLHIINFVYIFGGWIFLSHYLDNYYGGIVSVLLSLVIVILINIFIIKFSTYKIKF